MEYSKLLDLAMDLGHHLAMGGAETYRVEESVTRMLAAYEIEAEVFVIPNCMHISIEPVIGRPLTRMRRIGHHGNDLEVVERYNALSRRICREHPAPEIVAEWLEETAAECCNYSRMLYLLGHVMGAFGFAFLFGGNLADACCAALCGLVVFIINRFTASLGANEFFRTIAAAFPMSLLAYALAALGLAPHPDAVNIGALMILVPGLLFTNAMRDIIYGDTNSGINRIVQVLLIAVAIALGTAVAWNVASNLWGAPTAPPTISYSLLAQLLPCFLSCLGFAIIFNIHGPGMLLCTLGGVITWAVYILCQQQGMSTISAYFWASVLASAYSEIMARIRKYPAISYLLVSIFPLLPGAGVYYTMNYAVRGQMDLFASEGMLTASIAGVMAVGILLVSTSVRLYTTWRQKRK